MDENIQKLISEISEILSRDIQVKFVTINGNGGAVPNMGQRGVWNHQIKDQINRCFEILKNTLISDSNDVELLNILTTLKLNLHTVLESFSSMNDIDLNLSKLLVCVNDLSSYTNPKSIIG